MTLGEDGQPTKWKIENSWSDEHGDKGYYQMSADWFDQYVYQAVINRKYLTPEQCAEADSEPIHLQPWDPMGLWPTKNGLHDFCIFAYAKSGGCLKGADAAFPYLQIYFLHFMKGGKVCRKYRGKNFFSASCRHLVRKGFGTVYAGKHADLSNPAKAAAFSARRRIRHCLDSSLFPAGPVFVSGLDCGRSTQARLLALWRTTDCQCTVAVLVF